MELNVAFWDMLKLAGKFVAHKIQQTQLATKNTEIVCTSDGKVKGLQRNNIYEEYGNYYAFEGIPYAKPPIGDLRFRAPQPAEPWGETVLDCTNCKSKPLQRHMVLKIIEGSEDCLYLNVYAKELKSEKPLPVMVWIYGGGFQIGEATRDIYAPDYFMTKDVILVTLNYRLSALGFLSLSDPDLQIPGNAGLKDQVMALKWIKKNIHNFNGDSNNITVFGESAGGASAHIMSLIPQTKDLFHKAIIHSGSSLCPWANVPQNDWPYRFASHLGYKGNNNDKEIYRYLAQQDAKRLIIAETALLNKQELNDGLLYCFGPSIEPYATEDCITTKPYRELLSKAWSNDIPVIIGGTSFEGLFYYRKLNNIAELGDCSCLLPDEVKKLGDKVDQKQMAEQLKKTYFGDKQPTVEHSSFEYMDLMSHRSFWHDIYRTINARTKYAAATPTYCYIFDFDSPHFNHYRNLKCGNQVRGVSHADDLSYMFYNINATKLSPNEPEFKCIQRMVGMWYQFALTGNPNCAEIQAAKWEPIAEQQPLKCLNISHDIEFKTIFFQDKLDLWDSFYPKELLFK